jgi:hypothetical protein
MIYTSEGGYEVGTHACVAEHVDVFADGFGVYEVGCWAAVCFLFAVVFAL